MSDGLTVEALTKETQALKDLLKVVVELLPRHTADCGVHSAHPSYGSRYCSCKLQQLRERVRNLK